MAIPLGGAISYVEKINNSALVEKIKPFIVALGGGILLSAISLVLIPKGIESLNLFEVSLSFLLGGFTFFYLDKRMQRLGSFEQLMATLLDFIPESIALGALFQHSRKTALFLGIIIGLQNLPEGFNSFLEISESHKYKGRKLLGVFFIIAFLGPIFACLGYYLLADQKKIVGYTMVFSSAGIIYLLFQDIAPESKRKKQWSPALGGVLGFLCGLIGHMILG